MELRTQVKKINLTSKENSLVLEISDDMLGEKLPELKELIGEEVTIDIKQNNVQGEIWDDRYYENGEYKNN